MSPEINYLLIFLLVLSNSLKSQSIENSQNLESEKLLKDLFFSSSSYWLENKDYNDFEEASINEKSISGKDLWEIKYCYQKYETNVFDLFETNLNSSFSLFSKLLESEIGKKIEAKVDLDNEFSKHGITLLQRNRVSEHFDLGVAFAFNYLNYPDLDIQVSEGVYFVKSHSEISGYELSLNPHLKFNKKFFKKNQIRFVLSALFGGELNLNLLNAEETSSSSRLPYVSQNSLEDLGKTYPFDGEEAVTDPLTNQKYNYFGGSLDGSTFSFSPNTQIGFEFWINSLCLNPSVSYRKDFITDNYIFKKSIAIYWVIGLYDSVFLKYGEMEDDFHKIDEFQLGLSITRL